MELPDWATHVVNFGPAEPDPAHTPHRTYGAFMEHVARHAPAGGLHIMDLGDGRVVLDFAAVDDLRRAPADADGCIDDDGQIWIAGLSWPVTAIPRFDAADCAAQGHAPADHIDPAEVRAALPDGFHVLGTQPPATDGDGGRSYAAAFAHQQAKATAGLLTFGQLRDRMYGEHAQCAIAGLCCNDPHASWHGCPHFALVRMRGICHTAYVTLTADPGRFLVVDITTDGPSAACGGTVTGAASYFEAVRTITAGILTEWFENEHGTEATATVRVAPVIAPRSPFTYIPDPAASAELFHASLHDWLDAHACAVEVTPDLRITIPDADLNSLKVGMQILTAANPSD